MSNNWDRLESSIKKPEHVTKGEEYRVRDTMSTVFNDNKLWFFSLKGVDPTSYEKWHETLLLGSFLSIYDLATKKWHVQDMPVIDPDKTSREYLFTVGDKVFLFIYSSTGNEGYPKLLQWNGNGFKKEVKIDHGDSKKDMFNHVRKFVTTPNGFFMVTESSDEDLSLIAELKIDVDPVSHEAKGAKFSIVAKVEMDKNFGPASHVTGLAFNNDKLFIWGGRQGCGFRWIPEEALYVQLDHKTVLSMNQKVSIPKPIPPYCFSGPHSTIQFGKHWVMLGGSRQIGMCDSEPIRDIWVFDTEAKAYKKTSLEIPPDLGHVTSFAFDYQKGDLYVCDHEKGIYKTNLKSIL